MTATEVEAFQKFLTEHKHDGRCLCGTNHWVTEGPGHVLLGGSVVITGLNTRTLPTVMMCCQACGHIRLYSWMIAMGKTPA